MSENQNAVQLTKSVLHGNTRALNERTPVVRGHLPEAVVESIDVPVPLTGLESNEEITVLYIDDDTELTELTKLYLEREDESFTVVSTTNAVQGLELLRNNEFDCVVSDYDMPNTDGIELLKIVRETHPMLPFILFTAKGAESVASEAFTAGATDYMQKEIGSEQYELLANRVRSAVEHYRMQQYFWNALSWYKQIVEQNVAGILIVQNHEIMYANQQLATLLRYTPEELVGTAPTELASSPEDETRLKALVEFERSGEETLHVEASMTRRDGVEVPVEIHGGPIHHEGKLGCLGLVRERADEGNRLATDGRSLEIDNDC